MSKPKAYCKWSLESCLPVWSSEEALSLGSLTLHKFVRFVSVKAERPNYPSRSHARQGGQPCGGGGSASEGGGSSMMIQTWLHKAAHFITFNLGWGSAGGGRGPPRQGQWRHVHDSIRPIRLTVALSLTRCYVLRQEQHWKYLNSILTA